MTTYLLSAFPDSFWPEPDKILEIRGISEKEAIDWCSKPDFTQSHDGIIEPRIFTAISAIGQQAFADVLSLRWTSAINARKDGALLPVTVPANRITITPKDEDVFVIVRNTPPYRLSDTVNWTDEQIIKMKFSYSLVIYPLSYVHDPGRLIYR